MSELENALAEFQGLQLAKFRKRAERHPEDDVCVDTNLRALKTSDIDGHYCREIQERWEFADITDEEAAHEDVDVANMAFLSWYVRTRPKGASQENPSP